MDSIFRSVLKKYLSDYQKPIVFKKIANVYLNGNSGELANLEYGLVKFDIIKSSSNNVQLNYESESIDDLLEFEDDLRRLVFVSSSKAVLPVSVYSDMNIQVKKALHVIETCFEKYRPEDTFISFNGGKDCTVLLHLMLAVLEKHYPCYNQKPICLYVQSQHPFPEQEEFVDKCQRLYSLEVIKLQMDIKNALKITLRDNPNLKACLMGTRRTDPFSQSLSEFQMTDKGYPEVMRVNPLLSWSYFHIWDYLLYYKIPYCKLYDSGYTSLGNVDNTLRNSALLYKEFDGEEKYLPAYKLLEEDSERSGRNS
ncbi:hypothetical protein HHI36_019233 [Cryptolaemus montrouzieri]|uniref:FAD synthase n=1 Tax=Cryptolaemus montrouzieri TaxID=559131 RepID=A0ABD2P2C9_9CUCU